MSADIYGRTGQDFGGAIAADAARVIFAGNQLDGSGVGMLVQSLKVNYQQQITRIYEIGSDKTFYVIGRTQGQVEMGRIMGPRPVQLGFYNQFGNACLAATNNINFQVQSGCSTINGAVTGLSGTAYSFTIKAAVIINIGLQVGAQDMVINEQVQMMFTALNAGLNN
jgi:hypothetical protein